MPALWVVLLAAILIAVGAFLLYNLDRSLEDTKLLWVILPGIVFVGLGLYLIFGSIPVEVIKKKVWGIVLFLFGWWFAFRFPGTYEHQPKEFGWTGFVVGTISLVIGVWLIFFA